MVDFNISYGKAENAGNIAQNEIKGGIKKADLKDEALKSIFDAIDNGNGILEDGEANNLTQALVDAAKQDGDEKNLSKNEAKSLLKSLGLTNIKIDKLFEFLNKAKSLSANIDYTIRDIDSPDEIRIKYKENEQGITETEIYDNNGQLLRTESRKAESLTIQNNAGEIVGGEKPEGKYKGKYTRKQNSDGGYTDTYEDGTIINYNQDGKEISGKLKDGNTYTVKYNADGSYTENWSDGQVSYYDKNGRETGGKLANGITWENTYNEDGSYTQKFSNGQVEYYDKNGRETGCKLANGITWENTYNEDGSYTQKLSNGQVEYYDKNGRETGGKLANGITWENTYNEDGSYTENWSDGQVSYYDKNRRETGGKLANGITWENTYNEDGSYTQKFSNGQVEYYDKNKRQTGGKLANGRTWTNTYNEDGSFTATFSDGEVLYYDKNERQTGGKLANGTTYECLYDDNGKLKYKEFTCKDGSKYYWGADGKSYAQKTANGNIKADPKQGETFNDTMLRLGISDPEDQKIFIKANPKAYKRGYFILSSPGNFVGDVYIPKSIADKLDISNILVDGTAEYNKHKQAKAAK